MNTRIVVFIFTLAGMLITAVGAWVTAQAVIIDQHQAVGLGVPRLKGDVPQEILASGPVQALLAQSLAAAFGLRFIFFGSLLQALAIIISFFSGQIV